MNNSFLLDFKRWSLNEAVIPDPSDHLSKALDIVQKLINRGFTKEEASAIAGNLWHESKFNPAAVFGDIDRTPLDDMNDEIKFIKSNKTAYGLMQWRADRKNALADFAKSKGKHPANARLQADFMKYELKDKYDGTYAYETTMFQRAMQYGKSVADKARGFAEKSERSESGIQYRVESAEVIYNNLKN